MPVPCECTLPSCYLVTFYPTDKLEARAAILPPGVPHDSFIVGVVGRNQLRKRLDLTIEYFARWIRTRRIEDAYLLLHVAPTGDTGADLLSLSNYYGIADRVLVRTPHIGQGDADTKLRALYNSLDVLTTTSQAEGWDLPVLESMSCGVPCLVPEFAALGPHGWTRDAAVRVPCTSTSLTAPLNRLAYTIGGIPDRDTFVSELHALYSSPLHRQAHAQRGLRLAAGLSWERCGREFVAVVEEAMAEHHARERRRVDNTVVAQMVEAPCVK